MVHHDEYVEELNTKSYTVRYKVNSPRQVH